MAREAWLLVLIIASACAPAASLRKLDLEIAGRQLKEKFRPEHFGKYWKPPEFLRHLHTHDKDDRPTFSELSDLRGRSRMITVVTTACMPWMTGTAINPLLRAVYLERRKEGHMVSLLVPWLPEEEQKLIHPQVTFKKESEQEDWIRQWVHKNLGFTTNIRILWYEGKYRLDFGSIFPIGDLTESIPQGEGDVIVLEEPEHITWFHRGRSWAEAFNFVVGVVHTNYWNYAIHDHQVNVFARLPRATILHAGSIWVSRCYCHRVVQLSDAVLKYPNSITSNIHGVRSNFIDIGASKIGKSLFGSSKFSKGAYFIGKALWAKGHRQLLIMLKEHLKRTGENLEIDIFGNGPDLHLIQEEIAKEKLKWNFMGPVDHADPKTHEYKVMINPSLSDVVCTTTAEALAMGKFVVCADHPSNEFFKTFRNCFVYSNAKEFSLCLQHAMAADPAPLTDNDRYRLSWEAATERFYDAAYLGSRKTQQKLADQLLAKAHRRVASWDIFSGWLPAPKMGPPKERMRWEFGAKSNLKGRLLLSSSFLAIALMTLFDNFDKNSFPQ